MTAAIIVALAAFVIVGVILARQTSERKKEAVQSLKEEREAVGEFSITELAAEEIRELGLRDIEGADNLSSDVVLRVWKTSESVWQNCARDQLRYVVADGVHPADAVFTDVHLECVGGIQPPEAASDDE